MHTGSRTFLLFLGWKKKRKVFFHTSKKKKKNRVPTHLFFINTHTQYVYTRMFEKSNNKKHLHTSTKRQTFQEDWRLQKRLLKYKNTEPYLSSWMWTDSFRDGLYEHWHKKVGIRENLNSEKKHSYPNRAPDCAGSYWNTSLSCLL